MPDRTFDLSIILGLDDKASAKLKQAGRAVALIGVGMTAAFAGVVKPAADFQTEMANVATMLDTQSKKFLPAFSSQLLDMSGKFGESTATLSKGLYDILSASIPAEKAIGVLEASTIAAKAGLTSTAIAADALTTVINSYGFAAEDASDISDLFFGIVKRGKTTFAELAPVIGRVATLASGAGLSVEELGASLATMTRSGIKTDEAITSLRGVLTAFLKPTKEAKEAAAEVGVELDANTIKSEGFINVVRKLNEATDEQKAKIFGNVRALAGISVVLKNVTGFEKDLQILTDRAGMSQEAFEIQTATLNFTLRQLWQTFKVLLIRIGTELIPIMTDLGKKIVESTEGIIDWVKENKELVKVLALIFGGVGALMTGLGPLLIALPTLVKSFSLLSVTGTKLLAMLGPTGWMIVGLTALAAAAKLVTDKFDKFLDKMNEEAGQRAKELKTIQGRIDNLREEQKLLAWRIESEKLQGAEAEKNIARIKQHQKTIDELNSKLQEQGDIQQKVNAIISESTTVTLTDMQQKWLAYYETLKTQEDTQIKKFESMMSTIQTGFATTFEDMLTGAKTVTEGIGNLFDVLKIAVLRTIAEEAAGYIALQIKKAIAAAIAAHASIPFVGLATGIAAAALISNEIRRRATLDEGAIVRSPITADLAMNRKPEAIIPLQSPTATRMLAGAGIGGRDIYIYGNTFVGTGGLDDLVDILEDKILGKVQRERTV